MSDVRTATHGWFSQYFNWKCKTALTDADECVIDKVLNSTVIRTTTINQLVDPKKMNWQQF